MEVANLNEMRQNLRDAFADAVIVAAASEPRIVVLDADVSRTTKTRKFRDKYPDRFYEFGIAEQNMFGAAAGLANTGLIPIVSTFAVFASMRAAEMVRTSIAYQNCNVKIIGGYAGLSNGKDGATHQSIEDVSIMKSFPNMTVMSPSTPFITVEMIKTTIEYPGPVYIRLEYEEVPELYKREIKFEIGKGIVLKNGKDITLLTYGTALHRASEAAQDLKKYGIDVEIIDMPTIKPFDKQILMDSLEKTEKLIIIEDQNIFGGMAESACRFIMEEGLNIKYKALAIDDVFTESGKSNELRDKYGIGKKDIINAARSLCA